MVATIVVFQLERVFLSIKGVYCMKFQIPNMLTTFDFRGRKNVCYPGREKRLGQKEVENIVTQKIIDLRDLKPN